MEYVGVDYHTRYAIATRMNKDGDILSKDRIASAKTRIRSVLFKVGERVPTTNILGPLAQQTISKFSLRDIYREEINSCSTLAASFTKQIAVFEEKIEKQAAMDEDTKLLMTVPGISFFSAFLIMRQTLQGNLGLSVIRQLMEDVKPE